MPLILRILFVASLFLTTTAFAANPGLEADLRAILEEFVAENSMAPSAGIYAECPALNLKWSGVTGVVARDISEKLTPEHTVRIASNTKTYVAAGILRLAEMGRLNLDDSLGGAPANSSHQYLSEHWRTLLAADCYDVDAITLRQILSHTSGLNEHSGDKRYGEAIVNVPQHIWTRDEQVQLLVDWTDPVGPPGHQYKYSDTGYVILGEIIEQITGLSLGAAINDLLNYRDLGLHATWWEYMEEKPKTAGPRAHQYFYEHDVTDWNASFDLYGGGGIVSSVQDMGVFMRKLIKGDVLHRESSLSDMLGNGTESYRLGLMCMELGGHLVWGHQGFWNTFAFHVPELDLTISGTVNCHNATNAKVLADKLIARIAAESGK